MAEPEFKPGTDETGVGPWLRHPDAAPQATSLSEAPVGGLILGEGDIELNAGRPQTSLEVRNTGDRPIQIGSHFHFFETNRALEFDRPAAFGLRLDIPSGTGVRFEPGDQKTVQLVPMGGKQHCYGFNNLVDGWTGGGPEPDFRPNRITAIAKAEALGFKSSKKA
ncbi:urease subunit beta [Isosphaeraceae bacterium EP7]